MTTPVRSATPRPRRNTELALIILAVGITLLAWTNVDGAVNGAVSSEAFVAGGGLLVLSVGFHLALRRRASYADPLLLPIATLFNGLGLVMIHRIDLSSGLSGINGNASHQLIYSAAAIVIAAVVVLVVDDHRLLRRYTYTAMFLGLALLLMPLLPVIGNAELGSQIWIRIGPMSFQPGEVAKILLAVFFAGYLVGTRDVLSIAGRKVLGFTLPRARDLGPILIAWMLSIAVLVFERDLGTSLLFFGLFVAMLYVATERVGWIAIGLVLFAGGSYAAYLVFGHVQERVALWLDPFGPPMQQSDQLAKGLMGMASGGLFGTGLGQGRPYLTAFPDSDFIFASFGEEIGLFGVTALLVLYGLFVERGIRTALGVRDGFGKLLAAGLAFSVGLQLFVVIGGITRVIPLTGLTTPFMSRGGTSLLANWTLVAILLRISDQARRPEPEPEVGSVAAPAVTEVVPIR